MNGWIRVGIVVSAIWFLTVAIYGGYEHRSYQKWLEIPCDWNDDCNARLYKKKKTYIFIEEIEESKIRRLNTLELSINKHFSEKYFDLKDIFEKYFFDPLFYWPLFNSFFYFLLFLPILAGLTIAVITPHVVRWISEGFNSKETS